MPPPAPVTPKKKENSSTTKSLWRRLFCCSPKKGEKADAKNMASPPPRTAQPTEMHGIPIQDDILGIDNPTKEQTLFCNLVFISLSNFLKNPLLAKILMMTLTQNAGGCHHSSMPRHLMEILTFSETETTHYHENPNIQNTIIHRKVSNHNNATIILTAMLSFHRFKNSQRTVKNIGTLNITYELTTTDDQEVRVQIKEATLRKYKLSRKYKNDFPNDDELSTEIEKLSNAPPSPEITKQLNDAEIEFHNTQWNIIIRRLTKKHPWPSMVFNDFGRPLIGLTQDSPEVRTISIVDFIKKEKKTLLEKAGFSVDDLLSNKTIDPAALNSAEAALNGELQVVQALPAYTPAQGTISLAARFY